MKTYVFYIKGGDYMKRKNEDTHPRVQWRGWISETKSEESCLYSSMSDTQNQEWYDAESTQKLQGKYFLKWFDFLFLKKNKAYKKTKQ